MGYYSTTVNVVGSTISPGNTVKRKDYKIKGLGVLLK